MPRAHWLVAVLCALCVSGCVAATGSGDGGLQHRRLLAAPPPPRPSPPPTGASGSGVTLSVNTTTVATSGSWVAVSWAFPAAGGPSPSGGDVLALYVPATANLSATAPVKFLNLSATRSGTVR